MVSRQSHGGPYYATWNFPQQCLMTISGNYFYCWRFRFAQYSFIEKQKCELPDVQDVQDIVANDDGDSVILFKHKIYHLGSDFK